MFEFLRLEPPLHSSFTREICALDVDAAASFTTRCCDRWSLSGVVLRN